MSSCTSIDALVTPYLDGELDPAGRDALERHVRACPPCSSRIAAERAVHDLLGDRRQALRAACASPTLRRQCVRALAAVPSDGPRPGVAFGWRARLAPLAAAAALIVIVGGAFLYQATESSSRIMAAQLAADHVKCFAMNTVLRTHQPADVVESAMALGFGWNMHLPLGAEREGLQLVGARPCLYGEGKVAHIMYRHNGQPVSLFMLPKTARADQLVEVLGHECAIWSADGRTFVLVGRESPADLEHLAAFVRSALR